MTTVFLKIKTDLKLFPKVKSYFSYQAAQNEFKGTEWDTLQSISKNLNNN
jgi:hypothetical protein